jgi:hypothetical protein
VEAGIETGIEAEVRALRVEVDDLRRDVNRLLDHVTGSLTTDG